MRNRVRDQRTRRGLSQAEIAAALGVSHQTLISIESGRYLPSLPLAFAIARFFDLTVDKMFAPEAGTAGRGFLRASHADREHVIDVLKAAFVQGRLTKDELDLRVGQTFASRTFADLTALTADLPAGR
jgi:putative transcriptional regulator